jgi:zeta-carotene desaturase
LLPPSKEAQPLHKVVANFRSSPITGIHFWFDRQITELEHAVLLDRTIQWMFHKSKIQNRSRAEGSYVELVVSASKSLAEKPRGEIVELALRELVEFFPAVSGAKLLKSTVIKEIHATYSPGPGIEACRPGPKTAWPRVFLSGDWIRTGWPATMEGAVRGGYLAAEALARAKGVHQKFLVPDLAARGFMRLFS